VSRLHRVQRRLEALALRGALALPERVQRVLAGRPVVREGQTLATETQLLLRMQQLARLPAVEKLPVVEGRDALLEQAGMAGGRQPCGSVRDLRVGELPGRLYVPGAVLEGGFEARSARTSTTEAAGDPLLVFFHGGGWVYGDLDSHDAVCRVLAERAGVRVLAVDYRLAPEAPFPAAYDDALAAYAWVFDHLDDLGADPARLAVGGDSAGGCLAATVALEAARKGWPLAFQLLVYPATDMTASMESRRSFGDGFYLTTDFMDLATESYFPDRAVLTDPTASPLFADVPSGLAPAYVATAGFDPLRDEGEAYARKLAEAGVAVELERFPDQIHGFFNVVGVGRRSRACVEQVASRLAAGLSARGPG
jgi:acetyl esterase